MTAGTLRGFLRPGDWFTLGAGGALVVFSFVSLWGGGPAERAVVRAEGTVVAELSLSQERTLDVPGPLGATRIEVSHGRARVAADPSPRQYCVHRGWLARAGEVAVCLPNRVSLEIAGRSSRYDSLNY